MASDDIIKVTEEEKQLSTKFHLPVLPLRDVVVYPHMVIPLFVGRERSVNALEAAMLADKQIFLLTQKNAAKDDPKEEDLYKVGTISTILQLLKLPDGTVKLLVEGTKRAQVEKFIEKEDYLAAEIKEISPTEPQGRDIDILVRSLVSQFEQYVKLNQKIPAEVLTSLGSVEEPSRLADTIAVHLSLKVEHKQELLETIDTKQRLLKLMTFIESEIDLLQIDKRIRRTVRRKMEKTQREYYLKEQMSAIQEELGELGGTEPSDVERLKKAIAEAGMPKEVEDKAMAELRKLEMMPPSSAEAIVVRNYIDTLVKVPWKKRTKIRYDLNKAEKILNEAHYGLENVKERIIEYLAVQQRVKVSRGPILCLVGPPGVGKTSLGQSIANATGRKFVRIALGGVRDEAEIRGHRRTYIGSMPGKIIQQLTKVKVRNPLIMLDEVDKMAMDFRGDPASALLEVLDPEQNHAFSDHYLEVNYDLSHVMFITTANSLEIPPPLLDRMEVIRLAGYTEDEKVNIAMRHLIEKQLQLNGLKSNEINLSEGAVKSIIRYYTREAGVRELERSVAKIFRKVVKALLTKKVKHIPIHITSRNLETYVGKRLYRHGLAEKQDRVGQVTGLAWTSVGGELLTIEASAMPGKGKAIYTGQLGDVMQESIQAAMSIVRSRAKELGIKEDFYNKFDIHVHVPEGATPKDGPSAGIGMCTALVSILTKIPVRADVAMTGEITLRGQVLPIGGLKEKLLAAHRGQIKHVIIPSENKRDLVDIPQKVRRDLNIHYAEHIDDVLAIALQRKPQPLKKD